METLSEKIICPSIGIVITAFIFEVFMAYWYGISLDWPVYIMMAGLVGFVVGVIVLLIESLIDFIKECKSY